MTDKESNITGNELFDITFIGAGPVALYGMYYAGLRMTKFKAIDMLEEVGGGLMALYPEKYIYDMAGFPKIMSKDLTRLLSEQATQYPHTFCLGETVTNINRGSDGIIRIETNRGIHLSKTVVICAGLGAYTPKKIDLPNVERLEGHGVCYCAKRSDDFRDKNVLIVGGGDAAFDYSMMLEPVARSITHIHRNDFFAAHEDSVNKVQASSVRMKFPFWVLKNIKGNDRVEAVTIAQSKTGEEESFDVDAIIFNFGFLTDLGPIAQWGLELEKNAIKVDTRMRTNIEGIYAAGDIVTYDGKLKLISTGCGEVAIAVNNAKHYINPKAKVNPGHSTDKHVLAKKKVARKLAEEQQSGKQEKDTSPGT